MLIFNLILYNIVCNTNTTTNANEIKALTRVESELRNVRKKGQNFPVLKNELRATGDSHKIILESLQSPKEYVFLPEILSKCFVAVVYVRNLHSKASSPSICLALEELRFCLEKLEICYSYWVQNSRKTNATFYLHRVQTGALELNIGCNIASTKHVKT